MVCFLHQQDMDLKHTQIKENHSRNSFFLVEEEAQTKSLDESRKKKKENLCALGSNHFFFFSGLVPDVA